MKNEQTEITIRVSDLCAAFLKAFKPILVLVLVFALLGGLFGVRKVLRADSNASEDDLRAAEITLIDAKKKLADSENSLTSLLELEIPNAEANVERARRMEQRRQDYVDNSLFYAIDPLRCGVSRVMLYVETDTEINPDTPWLTVDPQSSIALAYTKLYPFDTELLENVRRIMNTDADLAYISELVTVTNNDDRFVEICVYHEDAEVAKQVTDYLLNTLQKRLSQTVGEFSANVISSYVGYEINEDMSDLHDKQDDLLFSAQSARFNAEQTLQTLKESTQPKREQAIEDNKAEVESAEKALQKLLAHPDDTKATPKNILKKGVLYAVVFFVVGLVGACFLVCLKKVFSGRLSEINDVLTRFTFPLIGTLPAKKKRLFDKTIRKLEGEPDLDFETAGKATAQSLLSVVGDRRIALVSSAGPDAIQEFLPFIGDRIPVCGDLLKDVEAVKSAKDYDGFVLVEKRGSSRFDMIDAEARRIKSLGKQTEGIILL